MQEILKKIEDYALEEIMSERFESYAKEIIQDRAIPDVRDGLKPVQRRILYAMYKANNTHDKKYLKSAATVGDVLGKYHPHGDSSVYDAMVRMSQWWKQNCILIDMKGNNGSMDGDPPAAYRYTEARLSKISNELLANLEKNTVEFAPNFDDRLLEPTVLPAKFPNLLVNGAMGISAGYATNIPPHNLGEVIDATIKRIDSPNCHLDTILEIVKGPDFPTGGIACGIDGIKEAFKTGKGKVVIKSKYSIIKEKGREKIIITEIPFEVNKSLLVMKIEDIRINKKIEGIMEVRDESDREGLRIVIDLKNNANSELILNYLIKNTDLQINYNYNMVTIVNRVPKTLGLLEVLDAYINHFRDVIIRRSKFDLANYEKRMHIVEGLIKCLSILDEVIKVIRASKNKSDAKDNLVQEFNFTIDQAEAIVILQLYRLTNTDVVALEEEMANLKRMIEGLKAILSDEQALKYVMKKELKMVRKEYATERKTIIQDEIDDIKIDMEAMIPKEKCIVVITNEGYVKRVNLKSYSTSNEETTVKPGDYVKHIFEVNTLDVILLFTNLGNYLYVPVYKIGEGKWKDLGKHISNIIMLSPNEKIISSIVLKDKKEQIIFFTKNGMVKRCMLEDFVVSRYSKPLLAMKLKENDELLNVKICSNQLIVVTKNGYYLSFDAKEVPLVGAKASGVKGINLKEDEVAFGDVIKNADDYLNIFTNHNTAKRIKLEDLNVLGRAKRGNLLLKKTKTITYEIVFGFITNSKTLIGLKTEKDLLNIKNSEIPIMDLVSTGSNFSKTKILDVYKIAEYLNFNKNKDTEKVYDQEKKEEIKELTIDDFINEFKI